MNYEACPCCGQSHQSSGCDTTVANPVERLVMGLDYLTENDVALKYKLTIHPDIGHSINSFDTFKYETKSELTASINTVAQLLLFMQDKLKIMPNSSNMFISEELINGEWEEILDLD